MRVAANLYGSSVAGQGSPNTLQLLARAAQADSDEESQLQRAGFAGGVAGLLLGLVIAYLLYRRRRRRLSRT
jgi:uncharacterized protein involved in exopolysaccharide biosynthesis